MTDPKDRGSISTNLPFSKLNAVLDAMDKKLIVWDETKTSLICEVCRGEFNFEGARFAFVELCEITDSVELISAKPEYVQPLIDELEGELAEIVAKRHYRKAIGVNEKIESLRKLIY